jgi:hypothetical protein
MRFRLRVLTTTTAVAATALIAAPTAAADDCMSIGGSDTECSSPGNVQINDSPPAVSPFTEGFYPGPYPVPFAEGSG